MFGMSLRHWVRAFLLSFFLFLFSTLAFASPNRQSLSEQLRILALPYSAGVAPTLESFKGTSTEWLPLKEFRNAHKWDGKEEYWYKLQLTPEQVEQYQTPVVILPFVVQVLSVFSGSNEIYGWGQFGLDGRTFYRGYPIHMIPLKGVNLNEPLYIRVGSGAANIGVVDGVFLDDRGASVEMYFWLGLPNLALFILAMLIGFLSLFAFAAIRGNKTPLAYGLFALAIGTFVGSHSYTLRISTDWAKIRHSTELFSLYMSGMTFSFYLDTIFAPIDRFRILNKSWKFYAVFAACAAIGEATQWAPLFKWLRPWQAFTALIFLTVPYFTIRSMLSKSVESYFVGGGLIAFTIASFAGVIFSVGGGSVTAPIFHFFIISGVFLLLVGLGGVLVYRHYDANRRVIQYQQETAIIREAQARQEKDMEAARAVQQTLLPSSLRFPGFETMVHWTTADQTGGDWYAGHFDEKEEIAYLFLGDVTGHGFASALVTGLAHGAVASVIKLHESEARMAPSELLMRIARAVNHVVHESASRSVRAMSMIGLALNSKTGDVDLVNCGHPQVYRISNGRFEVLLGSGSLLGFHADPDFEVKKYKLEPGDRLFVYTDGVLENGRNEGKAISFAKLRRALNQPDKRVAQTHQELVGLLKTTWQDAPIEDDYTLILMQWGEEKQAKSSSPAGVNQMLGVTQLVST
jgi:serine phosphatase RsbU (regulator of sigma subunit)